NAVRARAIAERVDEADGALAVALADDVVERVEPLACFNGFEFRGVSGCDVLHGIGLPILTIVNSRHDARHSHPASAVAPTTCRAPYVADPNRTIHSTYRLHAIRTGASADHANACRASIPRRTDQDDCALRTCRNRRRSLVAARHRACGADETGRSRTPDGRTVPAAGLGGQRRAARRTGRRRLAARARAPALLPDQQGAVVAPRSRRAVRPGRAGKARR